MRTSLKISDVWFALKDSKRAASGVKGAWTEADTKDMEVFKDDGIRDYLHNHSDVKGNFTGDIQELITLVNRSFSQLPNQTPQDLPTFSAHFDGLIRGGYERTVPIESLTSISNWIFGLNVLSNAQQWFNFHSPSIHFLDPSVEPQARERHGESFGELITEDNGLKDWIRRGVNIYNDHAQGSTNEKNGIIIPTISKTETGQTQLSFADPEHHCNFFEMRFDDNTKELQSMTLTLPIKDDLTYVHEFHRTTNDIAMQNSIDRLQTIMTTENVETKPKLLGEAAADIFATIKGYEPKPKTAKEPTQKYPHLIDTLKKQSEQGLTMGFTENAYALRGEEKVEILSNQSARTSIPCFWV